MQVLTHLNIGTFNNVSKSVCMLLNLMYVVVYIYMFCWYWCFLCLSCFLAVVHPPARPGWPGQGNRPAGPQLQHEEHQDHAAHSGAQQCNTRTHTHTHTLTHWACIYSVLLHHWHFFTIEPCFVKSKFLITGLLTWSSSCVECFLSLLFSSPPSHYRPPPPPTTCRVSRWGSNPHSPLETLARPTNRQSPGDATYQLVQIFTRHSTFFLILSPKRVWIQWLKVGNINTRFDNIQFWLAVMSSCFCHFLFYFLDFLVCRLLFGFPF